MSMNSGFIDSVTLFSLLNRDSVPWETPKQTVRRRGGKQHFYSVLFKKKRRQRHIFLGLSFLPFHVLEQSSSLSSIYIYSSRFVKKTCSSWNWNPKIPGNLV